MMRKLLLSLALFVLSCGGALAAGNLEKSERLVNLHDLKTSVAMGDYYLKQEAILNARSYLRKLGQTQNFGSDWTLANPHWQAAEAAIVQRLMQNAKRDFSSMEWLSEEWTQMNSSEFSDQDLDALLAHLNTEVGRKQVMIVDHQVAFHVMASLSMAGKIQESLPGIEADRRRMQDLYNLEDDAMRFNINENPEGTRFAMSPVGKKYFVNAVLKVSGLISRRLYQMSADMPKKLDGATGDAEAAVAAYRQARANRS